MDYSPTFVRHGRHHVQEAVERAHATFEGFREDVKTIVADDERVVVHFTIKGRVVGWEIVGPTCTAGAERPRTLRTPIKRATCSASRGHASVRSAARTPVSDRRARALYPDYASSGDPRAIVYDVSCYEAHSRTTLPSHEAPGRRYMDK